MAELLAAGFPASPGASLRSWVFSLLLLLNGLLSTSILDYLGSLLDSSLNDSFLLYDCDVSIVDSWLPVLV